MNPLKNIHPFWQKFFNMTLEPIEESITEGAPIIANIAKCKTNRC